MVKLSMRQSGYSSANLYTRDLHVGCSIISVNQAGVYILFRKQIVRKLK